MKQKNLKFVNFTQNHNMVKAAHQNVLTQVMSHKLALSHFCYSSPDLVLETADCVAFKSQSIDSITHNDDGVTWRHKVHKITST